jgi:LemA protein
MIKKIPTWVIVLASVTLVLFFIGASFTGTYNNMVSLRENVNGKWAQVQNVYQRRSDLIPNLVATVKAYAAHEKETLTAVIEARSQASQMKLEANDLSPENLAKFQSAQKQLSGSLSRLMLVIEKYPDLKANENFLALQSQLEGTENRIANERRMFNDATKEYNTFIKLMPQALIAGITGFKDKAYFEADKEAEKAPKVSFE